MSYFQFSKGLHGVLTSQWDVEGVQTDDRSKQLFQFVYWPTTEQRVDGER
jgi:hypothetical protein